MPEARGVLDLFNLCILKYQACNMMYFTSIMLYRQLSGSGLLGSGLRAAGGRAKKARQLGEDNEAARQKLSCARDPQCPS
jgi:hypothetical protein